MAYRQDDPMPSSTDPYERTRVVERRSPPSGNVEPEALGHEPRVPRGGAVVKAVQTVYLVFGLVETLILIRFLLLLLGANADAGFAEFIYGITHGMVAPFAGLFSNPRANGSVLELSSLVAMIIYPLVAWLVTKVIWLIFSEPRSGMSTSTRSFDPHR
jgi:hypothetical protein